MEIDPPLLLMVVLTVGALLIPSLSAASGRGARRKLSGTIALLAILASVGVTLAPILVPGVTMRTFSALFRADLLGLFFSTTALIVALLVAVASFEQEKGDPNADVFFSLLLFTALGMSLLAFSADLLMIFAAWQLMSLPTFVLTGFRKKDPASTEAAVKFFVLGAFSSGILLYGISITYGLVGSTSLERVVEAFSKLAPQLNPLALVAVASFIAGFGLKMAVVPFHMWLPDALDGAPTTVSALLAAGTKKAGFAAAFRVLIIALAAFRLDLSLTLAILALITMTLGNVAALTQRSVSRMLAYSSIAQAGYILIGFAVATPLGLSGALFHIINHAVMKSAAFIGVAAVMTNSLRSNMESFNGLGRRMPLTAFALTISLLALAGIPPLNGFWSKVFLFTAAMEADMSWLALAGALNSAFSLAYYAWIVKRMYLDEPSEERPLAQPVAYSVALVSAAAVIILTGIFPASVYEFAYRAATG